MLLDLTSGKIVRRRWLSDPDREPPGCHAEATVPAWVGSRLLVPTRAALYEVDPATLEYRLEQFHPWMTDLHSVAPRPSGGVVLTSTGIDAVLEFPEEGEPFRHNLAENRPCARQEDFRRVAYPSLKPHLVHPNYACFRGDELWVTRFEDRCARSLSGREVALPEGHPHDGVLRQGLVWYTTTTGHVIAVDPDTLERREHYDLNELTGSPRLLGWCRGVEVVGERVYIGMTQLRDSQHREVLRWLARGEAGRRLPTRVVELERGTGRLLRSFPVGNRVGGTIHGLLAL
ncbi:MAG: hypothetical protein KC912_07305 [Proteobacteria bacterium]|nr:hypothetical protein [Pseudomonadota bacterium]